MLLVTRPQPQADEWLARLSTLGVEAAALPLLAISAAPDPAAVARSWRGLAARDLVVLVSPSAVQQYFAQRPSDAPAWPDRLLAGSTGPGTASALAAAGVSPALIVSPPAELGQFDSQALWRCLQARRRDWAGASVLVVRGEGGRDWLAEQLRGVGAGLDFVTAYRRVLPAWQAAEQQRLAQALAAPQGHVWLFSSSQALRNLRLLAPAADWSASRAIATHGRIADAATRAGFGQVLEALPTPQAVASALTRSIQSWPP